MAGNLAATNSKAGPAALTSMALGTMALFGVPARFVIHLAGPTSSDTLLIAVTGLQILMAVGAVTLGLMSKPAGVTGSRPPTAWAGIALGGLTLALGTVLAALLTFNYVGNSVDRSVIETDPIILHNP
jgi:hypothetical protein